MVTTSPAAAISEPHRISARGPRPSRGIRPHCAARVAAAPAIMTIAIDCLRPMRGEAQPVDDEEADAGQRRRLGMAGDHPGDDPVADARVGPFQPLALRARWRR